MAGANNTTIGGTVPGARNIISGNGTGVAIDSGSRGILVQGNFIGTDLTGTVAVGNFSGVSLGSESNMIGGTVVSARNIISGNESNAIGIGNQLTGNNVQGNFIGTTVDGVNPLANGEFGLFMLNASGNIIGGASAGAANVIAFNMRDAVLLTTSQGNSINNRIFQNSIHSNGGLGINLTPFVLTDDGVTPNDFCDTDTGPNRFQNYPELTSAVSNGSSITIRGTLGGSSIDPFRLEFFSNTTCDPSGFGEGQTFVGATTFTTNGNCNVVSFTATFFVAVPPGSFITATASEAGDNTSEFSQCVQVVQGSPFDSCVEDESNGNRLLFSSSTGAYQFTNCKGLVLSGNAIVTRHGCRISLQGNSSDRRLTAQIDSCSRRATASLQFLPLGTTFTIIDKNIANNSCVCPVSAGLPSGG
jgi:titin